MKKSLFTFLLILIFTFSFFTSCNEEVKEPVVHNVSFVSNGKIVDTQSVLDGDCATEFTPPAIDGYVFAGWYADTDYNEKYSFSSPVHSNLTIYAKWISDEQSGDKPLYSVVFDTNGGTAVNSQQIAQGGQVFKPADPSRDGFVFTGWFIDSALTKYYDFSSQVTGNMILYAGWRDENDPASTFSVEFQTNGGTPVLGQTVEYGKTVQIPSIPIKANYKFDGWYSDDSLTTEYDFSAPVYSNLVLYAKWIADGVYTVEFILPNGEIHSSKEVISGNVVEEPAYINIPQGMIFRGWFLDGASDRYDFSSKVTSDLRLYAMFESVENQFPIEATSAEFFSFHETENGNVELIGYSSSVPSTIYIPDSVNGKRIIGIGEDAFSNSGNIESISTSADVIGKDAFKNSNVKVVELREGVKEIQIASFNSCVFFNYYCFL